MIIKLLARVAERSYRRGAQQGITLAARHPERMPDLLCNWRYDYSTDLAPWLGKPFWELPIDAWDEVIDIGVRSHYVAARFGVPMMLEQRSGLIVNISSSGAVQYAHTVSYGVGKAALDRMSSPEQLDQLLQQHLAPIARNLRDSGQQVTIDCHGRSHCLRGGIPSGQYRCHSFWP